MAKPDTYERSYDIIMNQLLSFPTISEKDWKSCSFGHKAPIGSLVSLQSAPPSRWQISWLEDIEYQKDNDGKEYPARYLMKSIKDYELCWWSNVGMSQYIGSAVEYPEFKWTDRQFALNDRWKRVCYQDCDAYLTRPNSLEFLDGYKVKLSCRRHILTGGNTQNEKVFDDWRKLTKKMMTEFYLWSSKLLEISDDQ